MQDCIFCKIVSGEIPSRKIYEDKGTIAFLDINPSNPGHTLVVPKKHSKDIVDAEDAEIEKLFLVAKEIVKRLRERLGADGVNVLQNNGRHAGQVVDHIHLHVMPRFSGDSIVISYPRVKLEEKDFDEIQKKLGEERKVPKDWEMDMM